MPQIDSFGHRPLSVIPWERVPRSKGSAPASKGSAPASKGGEKSGARNRIAFLSPMDRSPRLPKIPWARSVAAPPPRSSPAISPKGQESTVWHRASEWPWVKSPYPSEHPNPHENSFDPQPNQNTIPKLEIRERYPTPWPRTSSWTFHGDWLVLPLNRHRCLTGKSILEPFV